jgi:microcystin degradation protein MlrC
MARIAFGGFQHETNTFAPSPATFADFERAGGWPGLTRGEALFAAVAGVNIPIAGFIEEARQLGHELLPLSWAQATPSAQVTDDAFERITGQILEDLAGIKDLDGLYLDLHGAMVTESHDDGEGEILRRVRDLLGPDLPVVASLDLHTNVTPGMVELADGLVIFRTYPHVDMAATGARAARHLDALLSGTAGQAKAFRQLPFLIPVTSGCTLHDPAKAVYDRLPELEAGPLTTLSFACGFPPADIWHCGASAVAYGRDQPAVQAAVDELVDLACAREAEFGANIWPASEGVGRAIEIARRSTRPVILADTQDNPGGGANSDTVGLLEELLTQGAEDVALAILYDPEAALKAHEAGEGARVALALGAKSGLPGHRPLEATFRVERLGDGNFIGTGPFYGGARMRLGPMALLVLDGVKIVVGSHKLQAADQAIFRHLGVEPARQKFLALKSSVHFRADFQPIAEDILVVASPGPNPVDYDAIIYERLRPGLRRMPRAAR